MDEQYEKLMQYSLMLLAKKRYTMAEMRKKMQFYVKKRKLDEGVVSKAIERLVELRYLDDEGFARDYVNQRVKLRPRGAMLIKRELKMKGLKEKLIDEVLKDSEIDEIEMATRLLEKKWPRWAKYKGYEKKNKAFQFLYSKGFERDAIYRSVECCYDSNSS